MPKVLAQGKTIECDEKANLRKVLLHNSIDLYNNGALFINCRGIGSCGTCAVKVAGQLSPANWRSGCAKIASSPFSYIKPTFSVPNSGFRRCESNKI